jgi:outer membrane immunogenic protein
MLQSILHRGPRIMNRAFLATIAVAAIGMGPALAADMPVKAPPAQQTPWSWAGFYVGLNVGGVWGEANRFYPDAIGGALNTTTKFDDTIIGFHSGAQWQFGQIVLGIESALSWGVDKMEGTSVAPSPPFVGNLSIRNQINHLSTIGGRAGFAWDRILIYGTGGFASARVATNYITTSTGAEAFPAEAGRTRLNGWYAGAGIDWVLFRGELTSLILGVEYQHFDLDSKRVSILLTSVPEQHSIDASGDLVRVRLTGKFPNWWSR